MALDSLPGPFDAVIMSEVLEHLIDPWSVLSRVHAVMRGGGHIFASSPNLCHFRVLGQILRGNFRYAPAGVMDWTHLRWFTPRTYQAMFEHAGFHTEHLGSVVPMSWKWRALNALTASAFSHKAGTQIMHIGRVAD